MAVSAAQARLGSGEQVHQNLAKLTFLGFNFTGKFLFMHSSLRDHLPQPFGIRQQCSFSSLQHQLCSSRDEELPHPDPVALRDALTYRTVPGHPAVQRVAFLLTKKVTP